MQCWSVPDYDAIALQKIASSALDKDGPEWDLLQSVVKYKISDLRGRGFDSLDSLVIVSEHVSVPFYHVTSGTSNVSTTGHAVRWIEATSVSTKTSEPADVKPSPGKLHDRGTSIANEVFHLQSARWLWRVCLVYVHLILLTLYRILFIIQRLCKLCVKPKKIL